MLNKTYDGVHCPKCGGDIEGEGTEWVTPLEGVREVFCVGRCKKSFSEIIKVISLEMNDTNKVFKVK